jgi:hypothetical protein
VAYLDLSWAVRGVDLLIRHRMGIQEFTDDRECILRVSLEAATHGMRLSDGTFVREGDLVLTLHFWNEHLPPMGDVGPSAAWANLFRRRMRRSLEVVAEHVEREAAYARVVAVNGAPPFGSRIGAVQMVRTGQRFGFDVIEPGAEPELRERIHTMFDSILLWGLAQAYNPAALNGKRLLRHRYQLWISRTKLLRHYGGRHVRA